MEGHQRRKQHSSQKEENTWETILIQKISCITVKIKNKIKKNSLKISIFQHL